MRQIKFCSIDLFCSRQTFEPRPQTEFLVETVAGEIGDRRIVVFDVFCGIGNIGVVLALTCPNIRVYGTDVAAAAIEIASKNAELHGVDDRVTWLQGNILEPLQHLTADIIVANPPYMPTLTVSWLSRKRYVYNGGFSGMKYFRPTAAAAWSLLKPGGVLFFETGNISQGKQLENILMSETEISPEVVPVPDRDEVIVIARKPEKKISQSDKQVGREAISAE